MPLTVTAMILTIAYNPQFALLMSFSLSLAMSGRAGHATSSNLLEQMGGLATAVLLLRNVRTRTRLVKVGGRRRAGVPGDDRGHGPAVRPDLEADACRRRPQFRLGHRWPASS